MKKILRSICNKIEGKIISKFYFFYYFCKNLFFCFIFYDRLINKKIYLAWHWSFGHQAQLLEVVARKYFKKNKILLFEIINNNRNNYLLSKFYQTAFENFFVFKSNNIYKCKANYFSLKIIFNLFKKLKNNILTYEAINAREQNAHDQSFGKLYNEARDEILEVSTNSYMDKILQNYNYQHTFDPALIKKCTFFLEKQNINLNKKKILNIFFRDYQGSNEYYDMYRNFYKFENYIETIEFFSKRNYIVFLHHNQKLTKIPVDKLSNTYEVLELSKKFDFSLLNLFLYFISDLQISQNSASQLLGSFLNKKSYCVDFFPFSIGVPGNVNILFPNIEVDKKILTLSNYVNTDFFYAKDFDSVAKCVPTTSSQILNFVTSDLSLKKKYNELLPNDSMIKKRNNNIYWCGDFN